MSERAITLRSEIRAAHESGTRAQREGLQAQYRALPIVERRELLTADSDDPQAFRHIVAVTAAPKAARAARDSAEPAPAAGAQPTLFGHFAVCGVWTEVESMWEGNFMESIEHGAFAKTIANDRERMRVTLNHGRDPSLGNKVLGRIDALAEDKIGAAYEVSLYRGIPELVLEGLADDAYGASFRFYVNAESLTDKPATSAHNPRGIPERVITEAEVEEFGPVTFPQYPEASAHLRSLTSARARVPATAPRRELPARSKDEWLSSFKN